MNKIEFNNILDFLHITQKELSILLGVTPRAVNMWATGARRVPGAVQAYLNLMTRIPADYVAVEVYRAKTTRIES